MLNVRAKSCKMKSHERRPACSSHNSSLMTCQAEYYTVLAIFRSCLYRLYVHIQMLQGQTEAYIVVVIFRCYMAKQKYILWWLNLGVLWPNRSIYCGGYI